MKFALDNLLKQKKLLLVYGITIIFITAVCYIFLAMLFDPYLKLDTSNINKMYMGSGTTLLIIIFSFCLMIYTNIYFLETKNKEISLMTFHGMTLKKMIIYQIYQNTFMYFIFGILGIVAGFLVTPPLINFIHMQLGFIKSYNVMSEVLIQTSYLVLTMYLISVVLDIGYIYRGKLIKMMTNSRQNHYRKKNLLQMTNKIYPILYILGLMMMFTTKHIAAGYIIFSGIGAIGGFGIMRYYLPKLIEKNKSSKWINNINNLVVFGELFLKFKYIGLFLELLILISVIITVIICFNVNDLLEMYRMIIAYIIMIPMITFCITYKNVLITKKNKKNIELIYKMGVIKKVENQYIKQEYIYLYGLLFILPAIYMFLTLIRFYIYENISINIIIIIMSYFIINLFISMIISYKTSIKVLKEV